MTSFSPDIGRRELTFADKVRGIQWGLVLLVAAIAGIGFAMLYSAANGDYQPWASRQMTRFAVALVPMIAAALIDIRYWYRSAYWIYAAWRWSWSSRSMCAASSAWGRSAGSGSALCSCSRPRS